jgi:hypothetical protein
MRKQRGRSAWPPPSATSRASLRRPPLLLLAPSPLSCLHYSTIISLSLFCWLAPANFSLLLLPVTLACFVGFVHGARWAKVPIVWRFLSLLSVEQRWQLQCSPCHFPICIFGPTFKWKQIKCWFSAMPAIIWRTALVGQTKFIIWVRSWYCIIQDLTYICQFPNNQWIEYLEHL